MQAKHPEQKIRVLYSFPHKLGGDRICHTAWHQVEGLIGAGAEVQVHSSALHGDPPPGARINPTLALGRLRIPYKLIGSMRAFALHDHIVARRLEKLAGQIDVVHTWPLGALQTLKTASRLGIPTVLERPNAHTRTYYELVQRECERLGMTLPRKHEHAYNQRVIDKEEQEYKLADRLLCPSEFVVRTFLNQGFPEDKLARESYGYDEREYSPRETADLDGRGLTMIFVGLGVPGKGLHFALEAWLQSDAAANGHFLIAGKMLANYARKLAPMLSHPSIEVLGQREDVHLLLRNSDILVLPSVGEGFGLVCVEAMGSGCVPLVSDACTEVCRDMQNALVHRVGDVRTLTNHINALYKDRALLLRLREGCLKTAPGVTWEAAGVGLLNIYRELVEQKAKQAAF